MSQGESFSPIFEQPVERVNCVPYIAELPAQVALRRRVHESKTISVQEKMNEAKTPPAQLPKMKRNQLWDPRGEFRVQQVSKLLNNFIHWGSFFSERILNVFCF